MRFLRLILLALVVIPSVARGQVVWDPAVDAPLLDDVVERLATPPASLVDALAAPARSAPLVDLGATGTRETWSRLHIRSGADQAVRWMIPLDVDFATVYVVGGAQVDTFQTGLKVPLADRSQRSDVRPVIAIDLPPRSDRWLVFHVRHDASGYMIAKPSRPIPDLEFQASRIWSALFQGMFLGLLFALAVYNLLLFVATRDWSHLSYVGYLVGSLVYWILFKADLVEMAWSGSISQLPHIRFLGLALAAGCYAAFTRTILQTPDTAPVPDRLLQAVTWVWAGLGVAGMVALAGAPIWFGVELVAAITSLVLLGVSLAAAVQSLRAGHYLARQYLVASLAMLSTGVIYILAWFGWMPLAIDPVIAFQVGVGTEALLLARALSTRIRRLRAERSAAEAARQQAESTSEALREAVALKSNLLSFAAHDLRTPLGSILGFSELLRMSTRPGSQADDFAKRIESSANRLMRLIQDLLTSEELERTEMRLQEASLTDLVSGVLEDLAPLALAKDQAIRRSLAAPCWVRLDTDRFHEVIENVISNAVKYSPVGGAIDVTVTCDGDGATLAVSDSGPGFTPEDLGKLYQPFTKLSARPTNGESSTGLGLSIAKKIVDAHDGEIEVSSVHGQGATVIVTLPTRRSRNAASADYESESALQA